MAKFKGQAKTAQELGLYNKSVKSLIWW